MEISQIRLNFLKDKLYFKISSRHKLLLKIFHKHKLKFLHWSLYWQSMFDATLKDRKNSFHAAPGTSMFIHWLVGMVYVFYFASFILLLREVLRPGVLWFLRNLNDPEFNPIQEVGGSTLWFTRTIWIARFYKITLLHGV